MSAIGYFSGRTFLLSPHLPTCFSLCSTSLHIPQCFLPGCLHGVNIPPVFFPRATSPLGVCPHPHRVLPSSVKDPCTMLTLLRGGNQPSPQCRTTPSQEHGSFPPHGQKRTEFAVNRQDLRSRNSPAPGMQRHSWSEPASEKPVCPRKPTSANT